MSSEHKCLDNDLGFHNYAGECWHNSLITLLLFTDLEKNNIQKILFKKILDKSK